MKYLEQDQPLDQEQQAGQPFVAPGFEEVEVAFNANFAQRGEVGAACAIYHHGVSISKREKCTLSRWISLESQTSIRDEILMRKDHASG